MIEYVEYWRDRALKAEEQIREYARVGMEIATAKARIDGDRDGWRERAENAEDMCRKHYANAQEQKARAEKLDAVVQEYWEEIQSLRAYSVPVEEAQHYKDRAARMFEIAKDMTRARNFWIKSSESWYDKFTAEAEALDSLKSALRTLGEHVND